MRKLCEALLDGAPFALYGDGAQSRDFTHVADAVDAAFRAALADGPRPSTTSAAAARRPCARSSGSSRSSWSATP